jgi:hypothetical protein
MIFVLKLTHEFSKDSSETEKVVRIFQDEKNEILRPDKTSSEIIKHLDEGKRKKKPTFEHSRCMSSIVILSKMWNKMYPNEE